MEMHLKKDLNLVLTFRAFPYIPQITYFEKGYILMAVLAGLFLAAFASLYVASGVLARKRAVSNRESTAQ